ALPREEDELSSHLREPLAEVRLRDLAPPELATRVELDFTQPALAHEARALEEPPRVDEEPLCECGGVVWNPAHDLDPQSLDRRRATGVAPGELHALDGLGPLLTGGEQGDER